MLPLKCGVGTEEHPISGASARQLHISDNFTLVNGKQFDGGAAAAAKDKKHLENGSAASLSRQNCARLMPFLASMGSTATRIRICGVI
jgi:hypothetical protein